MVYAKRREWAGTRALGARLVKLGSILAGILALLACCVGLIRMKGVVRHEPTFALLEMPVIQAPKTVAADEARLADDAEIVGVCANGCSRAYALDALAPYQYHVINDTLGGRPITVSFCDITNCLAVFTDSCKEEPLEIAVGGYVGLEEQGRVEGSMLLRVGSHYYRQDTGLEFGENAATPFPYPSMAFERTTWKQWRHAHPESDVFTGEIKSTMPEPLVGQ
jgi:hypothetical protein